MFGGWSCITPLPEFPIHQVPKSVGFVTLSCHVAHLRGVLISRILNAGAIRYWIVDCLSRGIVAVSSDYRSSESGSVVVAIISTVISSMIVSVRFSR